MCEKTEHSADCGGPERRNFLKLSGSAAALGLAGGLITEPALADALTKAQRDKMTPDDIIAAMKRGNARFQKASGKTAII